MSQLTDWHWHPSSAMLPDWQKQCSGQQCYCRWDSSSDTSSIQHIFYSVMCYQCDTKLKAKQIRWVWKVWLMSCIIFPDSMLPTVSATCLTVVTKESIYGENETLGLSFTFCYLFLLAVCYACLKFLLIVYHTRKKQLVGYQVTQ